MIRMEFDYFYFYYYDCCCKVKLSTESYERMCIVKTESSTICGGHMCFSWFYNYREITYTQKGKYNDVIATKLSCQRTNAQLYYYNEITVDL